MISGMQTSTRRKFLHTLGGAALGVCSQDRTIKLFLCGDVMTGRGIDQILPHPCNPQLHEDYVDDAREYVRMAERANGPLPRPLSFAYPWGDALNELAAEAPDLRIINLETSVTTSHDWMPKGINYRMNPKNAPCIGAAGFDCCVLANNHVLDWGHAGLGETLEALGNAGLRTAGAGRNRAGAEAPAVLEVPGKARVLVFSVGLPDSGIPASWAATGERAGVAFLPDLSEESVGSVAERVRAVKRAGDIVALSIHWGGNWGYEIPPSRRPFIRALVDRAGVDVVHGHSSHHPQGVEVYRNRPVLYGCGDFLNDYEGIRGYEEYRSHLVLMYFVTLDAATGELRSLKMTPMEIHRFRLRRAAADDAQWLRQTLDSESRKFGVRVRLDGGALHLEWS
jgi:poly-gamma-glutamate synthesis protein (capsule biosynthesis protein)